MSARFLRLTAIAGLFACSLGSAAGLAQTTGGTLPTTAAFDPSGADSYRILLSAAARRVSEDGCGARCAVEALILSSTPRDPENAIQLCFENVQLQKFSTGEGAELRGAMTSVAVTAVDENGRRALTRRFRALLQGPAGPEAGGRLCAPTRLELSGRKFDIYRDPLEIARIEAALAADEQVAGADLGLSRANATASVGPIGSLIGGLVGTYRAARAAPTDTSLLSRLFGYRSSRVIQLELRSTPPGASIIVDGRETGLRTDSLVALAVRSLRNLRVRSGRREVGLEKCSAVGRRAGIVAAYTCQLGR